MCEGDFMKIGQGIGKEVVERIMSAKRRVWVISPFISSKYSEILASKIDEGVDVRVITTSDVNLPVTRIGKFTHAKVYIIDDVCFWGSMNLTENGVERNVEVIEKVTDPDKVAKFEEEFLNLWEKSIDAKTFSACESVMFVKSWNSSLTWFSSCIAEKDKIYIATDKNIICFSKDGKILWRVPVALPSSRYTCRIKIYSNGYLLVYRYFGKKYFDSNKVKVYLIKDGYIITSFEYDGNDPWGVYFDPDNEIICILEKKEEGYQPIAFDLTGKIVERYRGRSDVKFFFPSVVRGDGVVEFEIPFSQGDGYVISPNNKMIAVFSEHEVAKDKIIKVKIYDIESKKVFKEVSINIGGSNLVRAKVDDDGSFYLLTEDSVYVLDKNDLRRIIIVKNEPMFDSPPKSITECYDRYVFSYYYYRSRTFCKSIFLLDKYFGVLLIDASEYKDEYGNDYYGRSVAHILIYSKEDFRLIQKILKVHETRYNLPRFNITIESHLHEIPVWIYTVEGKDFIILKRGECIDEYEIEYFHRVNLQPKIREFLNTVYKIAPALNIDPSNYILRLSELCNDLDAEEIISWINKESDILIRELQNKKEEVSRKLADIISRLENVVRHGYSTTKIRELLRLAREAFENIDKDLAEANDKLNFLEENLRKIESAEPRLDVNVNTESVGKYYRAVLKLKTDAELGIIAELKNVKGNVESFFEKKPIEVCPDAIIEVYLKPLEEGPIPVVFEIEYRYFDRVANVEKLVLLPNLQA